MRNNHVKNTTIKAALILGAALAFAAPAATLFQPEEVMAFGLSFTSSSTSSNSETCKGITKTTTTSTVNGKTETTVEYTDEDGNVLDEEIGEKAFKAAKSGVENPLESVTGEAVTAEKVCDASFYFENDTDFDIAGLYFTSDDCDDWGENWLSDDDVLEADATLSFEECVDYTQNALFKIAIIPADGEGIGFYELSFEDCEDPQNITITFTVEDGDCYIAID